MSKGPYTVESSDDGYNSMYRVQGPGIPDDEVRWYAEAKDAKQVARGMNLAHAAGLREGAQGIEVGRTFTEQEVINMLNRICEYVSRDRAEIIRHEAYKVHGIQYFET